MNLSTAFVVLSCVVAVSQTGFIDSFNYDTFGSALIDGMDGKVSAEPRSAAVYFTNSTAFLELVHRLIRPQGFTTQFLDSLSINGGRTLSMLAFGWAYRYLLENTRGERQDLVRRFDFFFNERAFGFWVGRNIRNFIWIIVGRAFITSIIYGPVEFIRGVFSLSFRELIENLLENSKTMTYALGMFLESFGEVFIFLFYALISNSGILGNDPVSTVRSARSVIEVGSVEEFGSYVNGMFAKILSDLEQGQSCDNFLL